MCARVYGEVAMRDGGGAVAGETISLGFYEQDDLMAVIEYLRNRSLLLPPSTSIQPPAQAGKMLNVFGRTQRDRFADRAVGAEHGGCDECVGGGARPVHRWDGPRLCILVSHAGPLSSKEGTS